MIGIYKIENLLNNKIYIGQSVNIKRRWGEHCRNKDSLIGKAINDFGKHNFDFQILEECTIDMLNDRENYYIKLYNSVSPNGYNTHDRAYCNHTSEKLFQGEDLYKVYDLIQNSDLTLTEIAKLYNVSRRTIVRINYGDVHAQDGVEYPLRKQYFREASYCPRCGKEKSHKSKICQECYSAGVKHERPNKDKLKELVRKLTFVEIGRMYNVSDNTIKKWCKYENIPYRKKDIQLFSDSEWDQI